MLGIRKWYYGMCGFNKLGKDKKQPDNMFAKILNCLGWTCAIVLLIFHPASSAFHVFLFSVSGLMRDDTIEEDADVKCALSRLPENEINNRMFRIKRALDLNMKQQILPKDQWMKFEEVDWKLLF